MFVEIDFHGLGEDHFDFLADFFVVEFAVFEFVDGCVDLGFSMGERG